MIEGGLGYPEEEGNRFLQNIDTYLPNNVVSYLVDPNLHGLSC
jgi:hypothetical protein